MTAMADPGPSSPAPQEVLSRPGWLSTLAKADKGEIEGAARAVFGDAIPGFSWLRKPEFGLAMIRGRAGGTGQAFNLGEITVTRCSLTLADGTMGTAYIAGRDRRKAALIALLDAAFQSSPDQAVPVVEQLAQAAQARREAASQKAAATKVDFFTLVRGDNPK